MREKEGEKRGLFGWLRGKPGAAEEPAAQNELPPEEPAPFPADEAQEEPDPPAAEPAPDAAPDLDTASEQATDSEPQSKPEKKASWFARLTKGLTRSSGQLSGGITGIFTKAKLDEGTLEELEDLLITADLGPETAAEVAKQLAKDRFDKEISADEVRAVLAEVVTRDLAPVAQPLDIDTGAKPFVILVVGVNGTGKTTTIGKLGHRYAKAGKSVMFAAGDTFRAAAIEQLRIWGERVGAPVLARETGADAAGLAFDALAQARDTGTDVLFIDTAGRLQNKQGLMEELAKMVRVLRKQDDTAPHAVLLVLDATTGQNALKQVEVFREVADVTGLVMTKLDGTARGGILVPLARRFALPVYGIGVGEGIDDLQPFEANAFARALVGLAAEDAK